MANICAQNIVQWDCVCPTDENGRVRGLLLYSEPIDFATNQNTNIQTAITNGTAVIFYDLNGSVSVDPVMAPGYGDAETRFEAFKYKITAKQLWSCALRDVYNKINKASNVYKVAYVTDTYVHYGSKKATVVISDPVGDATSSVMEWNMVIEWTDKDLTKCVAHTEIWESCDQLTPPQP